MDALRHIIKDKELRDNPPNPDYRPGDGPFDALLPVYNTDRSEIHDAVAAMRRVLDDHEAVMIRERERDGHRFLVVLNLGHRLQAFTSTNIEGRLALSTHLDRDDEKVAGALELRGEGGVIVGLD